MGLLDDADDSRVGFFLPCGCCSFTEERGNEVLQQQPVGRPLWEALVAIGLFLVGLTGSLITWDDSQKSILWLALGALASGYFMLQREHVRSIKKVRFLVSTLLVLDLERDGVVSQKTVDLIDGRYPNA